MSSTLDNQEAILRGLEEFRTHLGGRLTILLLSDIGQGWEEPTKSTREGHGLHRPVAPTRPFGLAGGSAGVGGLRQAEILWAAVAATSERPLGAP